jgi:DNA-binding transcriptional MerR regulator
MHSQRWRVEELAERTGLTVDTIRFYQKRRLLPPPEREGRIAWYDAAHLARVERIRSLQDEGLSLGVIDRLLDDDVSATDTLLAVAVAGREERSEGQRVTRDELVARTGVAPQVVDALELAGLIRSTGTGPDATYAEADAELVANGLALLDVGMPLDELLLLARRHHEATLEVAEAAVDMFDRHVRRPIRDSDGSADEKAHRLVSAFETLFPAVTSLVSHHFGRVLLELATTKLQEIDEPEERSA